MNKLTSLTLIALLLAPLASLHAAGAPEQSRSVAKTAGEHKSEKPRPGPLERKPVVMDISSLDQYTQESPAYALKVAGQTVRVNQEICNDLERNGGIRVMHTAVFDYAENALIQVTLLRESPAGYVSPQRLRIVPVRTGREITFRMPAAFNLVLVVPGGEPLVLLAAPKSTTPRKNTPGLVYFEKGIHEVDVLVPRSDTTYYLEEGAVLRGKVLLSNVQNVSFLGRGIIDARKKKGGGNTITISQCRNIKFEGIGVRSGAVSWSFDPRNTKDVTIAYVNLLSFGTNNDGFDIGTGCQNFTIHDCFVGCGDDGFGWHATDAAKDGEEPSTNLRVSDCLVWKSQPGNGIRLGSSLETTYFRDLSFTNIDMANLEGGHAIICDHSDWADVQNVVFEGIYNETVRPFIYFEIAKTRYTNPKGYRPGTIPNISFVNCVSRGKGITFKGYDAKHRIDDITLKNVRINTNTPVEISDISTNAFVGTIRVER